MIVETQYLTLCDALSFLQNKIELQATRSGRIVEQMFPGRLRDMVEVKEEPNNEEDNSKDTVQLPQADFFPDVSLMFGE
jgi:hypothetical protein